LFKIQAKNFQRLEFSKKLDFMMNLVVKWGLGGGACGILIL